MKTKINGILMLILVLIAQISFAQERTIIGTVYDESGPLPGVNVFKKGTMQGTETDFDGSYSIKAKAGDTIIFSFIGMETTEEIVKESNTINVYMQQDSENMLNEIVVVGYGTQKKSELTGAVSQVKGSNLANLNTSSFESQLAGRSSGVQIIQNSGIVGASTEVNI